MGLSDLKVKTSLAVRELLDRVQRTLQSVEPVRAGRALDLSELEERILLSVSPGIVVAEMTDAALADSMSVDTATLDSGIVTSSQTDSSTSNQQLSSSVSTDPTQTVSHEIVFLDTTVEDYQQLLDDLWSNNDPGREFEVVLLQNSRDGIEQITEALAGRTDLDAVHIVSHGTDSAVKLGSTWLTNDNLAGYVGEISRWSSALSVDADLLFYGCDLAASESGRTLLESVQTLTGADVAASTNDTGAAILGGDWELEYSVGSIETQIAFSQTVQAEWHGLLDTFTVTNTNDSGSGSLRQAIIDANSLGGTDTINFNINGGGVERIRPNSALPTITDTIIINGWSQPGFSSTPLIELRGDTAGASVDGLTFSTTSDGSIVRGLVIYDYSRDGILVQSGADNITIQGNWIGTAGTGTIGDGNGEDGIDLRGSSAIIGGTGANEGNVITNNGNEGITIQGSGVTAHLIQGNIIGLDPDGSTGVGNTDVGIAIISGSGNTIGGTTAAARNIISKNFEGIEINTANNVVSGNYIGTDITGSLDRGNRSDDGVEIQSSASGNVIGGEAVGAGNIIAFNAQNGVNVVSGTDNAIVRNSIFSNTLLGINLATAGVTANDIGDGDTGANNLQNFPVLTSAVTNGTKINIAGSFNSNASTSYRIEFYSNTTGDGTGYGEGQTLIGISDVTTNGTGEATFSSTFTAAVSAGSAISATVSRLDAGDAPIETSEFSQNVTATIDGSRDITFQNGTNSYTGTEDTELDSGSADTSKENNTTITVDLDDTGQAQGLIQFGSIFGSGPNQIPFGSTILSASLQLHVVDPAGAGDQITLHRMLVDWNESSTWNSLTGGISANDVEASSSADSTLADASVTGSVAFTGLASAVQAWSDGDSNYGWAILTNSINGWDIVSSEGATASERPQLIISYSSPPIISLPAGALIYTENDPATVIDGTATVTDSDSIDFNTGTLTVDFTANGTANDRLAILNEGTGAGQIGVSGSNVSYEGTTIGTFAGGTDGSTPLVITFNASSTPVGAQALLRNITYENVSESPSASPRTVRFVLTDGDGGTSNTATQTVNVTSVNDDPVFTSPSSVSVSENQSGVQTVTATDVDVPAQTLSFAITGGADELQFALNPTSGTLVFVSPQDFETPVDANGDNVYEVELTVSDGNGGSSIETLFVTVTNQNDNPPVVTPGQSFSVDENSANGTSLGSLMATDDDAGTTFQTWTITFDSSGGIFSLNSTTGELTVADNTNLNFESATSYTLFVRVSDGSTDSAQESVTISVGEVNEFDPVVNDQSFAVNENSTNGTVVGTVAASDADTRQSLSYVITAGNTNNAFAINSGTGQITVNNSSELDRETTASFALTVQVTDDVSPTRSDTATVTVNLNGVNDNTPVITSNGGGATAAVNVAENSTAVTTVTATDADVPTQTLSYSITGGADASLFNIDAMSGELTFASAPDFETPTDASGDNVYDFTVQVSDGNGGTVTQTIAVVVNDINELPSGSGSLTTTSLNDNAGATNLFGGLSVTDVDTGEADLSLTITLTTPSAGTISGGGFTEIEVGTGVFTATGLTTATADTALDNVQFSPTDNAGPSGTFNTDISVTVNDQGGGGEQTVLAPTTVTITRVNDAPAISLPGSALNYSENDTATLIDSTATVSDADSTIFDTGTLTIDFTANGTVSDRLAINNQGTGSGQIGVSGSNVSYEGTTIGTFTGGTSGSDPLVITFNANSTPTSAQALMRNITFANVSEDPSTASRTVRFVLTDGDGGTSNAATQTVNVAPENDAPTVSTTGSTLSYTENDAATVIDSGLVVADVDDTTLSSATVSISSGFQFGADELAFADQLGITGNYNAATGILSLTGSASVADYQTALRTVTYQNTSDAPTASRTISFFVDDGVDSSTAGTRNISISAQNDAPVSTADPGEYETNLLAQNPLSYWRLGETSGTNAIDDGSIGNTGTYNGTTQGQTGAIANDSDPATRFNGTSDYVEFAHDAAYLLDNGTVQLWFNADDTSGADLQHVFSKDSSGFDTGGHLSIYLRTNGKLEVRLQSTTTSYLATSAAAVSSLEWHHVAVSFGDDGLKLYLDGSLEQTVAYTGGLGTTSGGSGNAEPIVIGAGSQASGNLVATPVSEYFTGLIDEVAIIGSQLSDATVQDIYAAGVQNYQIVHGTTLNVAASEGVLANDFDAEGDALTAIVVTGPSNAASFTLNPNGSFDYTPVAGFSGTDSFTYKSNDGTVDGNSTTVTLTVTNDAPTVSLPGAAVSYSEGDAATFVDGAATVADSDSTDFDTGTLTVDFTANGTANDRLAILNEGTGAGQIGVSGSNVSYEGTTIGTFTGGTDGSTPLVITLNANATPTATQALARHITYENVSDDPSTAARTVRFVLTDGDGGTSNAATQTVNVTAVNDAPTPPLSRPLTE